jgi:dihydropteroate synthase
MVELGSLRFPAPSVMGILNVTPDSFSDGGQFLNPELAVRQAERMAGDGAVIIDVGGESTRPGAADVSEQEELDRVIPIIEAIRANSDTPVSIDTSKPGVMRAAVAAGAALINDVRALQMPGALTAAAELGVPVCLMHMAGEPRTMQTNPRYDDVVADVVAFLGERKRACVEGGIEEDRVMLDPGFGFGKSRNHNVTLLANLRQLQQLGRPLLVGISRKSTLGDLTGRAVDERMPASVAAAVIAAMKGAAMVRVHDVRETVDALRVATAVIDAGE